jgi:hypothetical protein
MQSTYNVSMYVTTSGRTTVITEDIAASSNGQAVDIFRVKYGHADKLVLASVTPK